MKKRPLCMMCMVLILIRVLLLLITSGENREWIPASSIFYEMADGEEIKGVRIQGRIYKKEYTSNNQVLFLKNNSISIQEKSYDESRMMIYDDSFLKCSIGETIEIVGNLQKFEGARNPGNFDQQLYYARQNIYGCVFRTKILASDGNEQVVPEFLSELKQEWKQTICDNMSKEQGPVLAAMLLNEKSDMDGDLRELYQKNGISHVLAISGLHISFIGLGLYQLLRKMGIGYLIAGLLATFILSSYVLMIGFSVSILRAYVMLLFRVGADMTGRVYDMATALAVAAAITVGMEQLYLTDAAFYLSYGAILAILLVKPKGGVLQSSLAIQLFLLPFVLWFYFEIPLVSVLLNIVVIPLTSWILGLGIAGSLSCMLWEPIGGWMLKICDWMLQLIAWMGEKGLELSFTRVTFGKPKVWEVLLYYVLFFVTLYLFRKKKKRGVLGIVFGLLTLVLFFPFSNGKLQVAMLDVGQGDCIFLRGPQGDTYLVDGGSSDVSEVGKYRVEPFLKSQGVGTLDYVFVSHGDGDHCNAIEELIVRQKVGVRIGTLVLPANYKEDEELLELSRQANTQGVSVVMMKSGDFVTEGDLSLECLQPGDTQLKENAGSMVLQVQFREFVMLFTGDVEGLGEEALIKQERLTSCDVLKVAHHGSKNSTLEDFLEKVQPKLALISAGIGNSYGHPHAETIRRLQEAGSRIYQTADYGAIILETNGELIDIFPSSI